jgi:thioredoxin-like negative regulator of GroEL
MKNKGTLGTVILGVIAVIVLLAIFAWGRTGTSQSTNTTSKKAVTTQPATTTTTTGGAGDLGPNVVSLTAANFNTLVVQGSANELFIAEAYAPWCPHCQKMGPIVLSLASQFNGKVKFGKMNADYQDSSVKANYDFAIAKNMQGYPTFWFYKNGAQVYTFSGEETQAQLTSDIQKYE